MWERQEKTVQGAEPVHVFCNLLLASESRPVAHTFRGDPNAQPVYGDQRSVLEVLQRVTTLAKRHWYVLDIHRKGPNKDVADRKQEHKEFMRWLPWNPKGSDEAIRKLMQEPAARLAPAPFCCVWKEDFFEDNYDESVEGDSKTPYSKTQVPQEFFFHRMYVNMSTQFDTRKNLHAALKG